MTITYLTLGKMILHYPDVSAIVRIRSDTVSGDTGLSSNNPEDGGAVRPGDTNYETDGKGYNDSGKYLSHFTYQLVCLHDHSNAELLGKRDEIADVMRTAAVQNEPVGRRNREYGFSS